MPSPTTAMPDYITRKTNCETDACMNPLHMTASAFVLIDLKILRDSTLTTKQAIQIFTKISRTALLGLSEGSGGLSSARFFIVDHEGEIPEDVGQDLFEMCDVLVSDDPWLTSRAIYDFVERPGPSVIPMYVTEKNFEDRHQDPAYRRLCSSAFIERSYHMWYPPVCDHIAQDPVKRAEYFDGCPVLTPDVHDHHKCTRCVTHAETCLE